MDSIDRKILAELQADGRLSITELAERVNLSLSPCHRRLRTLEQEGVITGYRANLDPAKMGFNFLAIVFATLKEGDKKAVSAFEEAVEEIPQIVLAQRLFGDPDYLMHVVTRDLPAFQKLYDDKLSAMPGVQHLRSTLVMKTVVQDRPFPLGKGQHGGQMQHRLRENNGNNVSDLFQAGVGYPSAGAKSRQLCFGRG
jgi:DNA-binding Lrp family transcriptional regulator